MADADDDDDKAEAERIRLHTTDMELLKAMGGRGENLVLLTPERIEELKASLNARMADIEARYPGLVAACPYETRLAVTAHVFAHIVAHATEGGTFRYLIYNRLDFGTDAYVPLYQAGGMTISNEFTLQESGHAREKT